MDKWEIKKVESPRTTEAKQEAVSVPAQVEAEIAPVPEVVIAPDVANSPEVISANEAEII